MATVCWGCRRRQVEDKYYHGLCYECFPKSILCKDCKTRFVPAYPSHTRCDSCYWKWRRNSERQRAEGSKTLRNNPVSDEKYLFGTKSEYGKMI